MGSIRKSRSSHRRACARGNLDPFSVGNLYLPNGNPQPGPRFDYKLSWFEQLNRYAARLIRSKHPIILCGDFNVVPTDFDIYDTKSWKKDALLQPESRAAFARLLKQGWIDALRTLYPDERVYTFWDYFRNHWQRNAGIRIDHVLLSPDVGKRLVDAGVDRDVRGVPHASDHAPVWIELRAADLTARTRPPQKSARKIARQKTSYSKR